MNTCPFERYKDIFGLPNNGAHSYRIFGFASVDIIATIIVAYLITLFSRFRSLIINFVCLMIAAILLHRLFCVNTKLNTILFGRV